MYRDLGNIEEKILQKAIQMGARNGVQKIPSKKLAAECDIASFTIFHKFGTMKNVIDSAAQYFDRMHMEFCLSLVASNSSSEDIWEQMLDRFVQDPDGTLFYISYTNVYGFDPTDNNSRSAEFLEIAKSFFRPDKVLSDNEYLILWDYITSMAFYYAEKFIHYMDYDEANKVFVKRIVFGGIESIIH